MSETERVTMVWPKDLKDQVREKAGKRGITEFVMEATQLHLGVAEGLQGANKELNEVKYFAQQLADQLALGGSAEERLSALMEIEFPSWVDTSGWPPAYAERVRPDYVPVQDAPTPEPEPIVPDEVVSEPEVQTVVEAREHIEVAPPPSVDLPSAKSDDLLAKIRAKAAEKGVDIDGLGLKPASSIPTPEKDPDWIEDPATTPEEKVERFESLQPEPANANLCPNCGDELVDGECWTC